MYSRFKEYRNWLNLGYGLAFPTDTVWGLGVLANKKGFRLLDTLKGRGEGKFYVRMIGDVADIQMDLSELHKKILNQFWPGAFTFVFYPVLSPTDEDDASEGVSFRIPNHPELIKFLKYLKEPLLVSSANVSGEKSLNNAESIKKKFSYNVRVLPFKTSTKAPASSVIGLKKNGYQIFREGEKVEMFKNWARKNNYLPLN